MDTVVMAKPTDTKDQKLFLKKSSKFQSSDSSNRAEHQGTETSALFH